MSSLFVSSGRKKLKLHDSAVMFEQRVWFSVLIMLPQANPPYTETTIRFLIPSVDSRADSHINRHKRRHGCWNTPTHTDMCAGGQTQRQTYTQAIYTAHTHTYTHPPSFSSKWFICSDLGEMIPCNETDREDDFFIHLGTKRAVALLFMVDSLYKHRQWVWSFPITPSHPLIISTLESARSDRRST